MKYFLALEITDQKLRYLVLEKTGKKIIFKGAGVSNYNLDSSAPESLTKAIKEIISKAGVRISRIFLTLNRRDTVIHQLSLSKMSQTDLKIIVTGEVEKIPSFTERDFDYIYKEYETENKAKTKVVFAAVAEQLLHYVIKEVKQTGIPCQELEIAPLNMMGLLCTQEFKGSTQTVITITESSTHLIIFIDGHLKSFYTTNTGTEALFPSYKNGKMDTAAVLNWEEELKRVLKSYTLDHRQIIEKSWLLWDRDVAPGFDEYLAKQFNFHIQSLNILKEWFDQELNPAYFLTAIPAIYYLTNIQPAFSLKHFFRTSEFQNNLRHIFILSALFVILTGGALSVINYKIYQQQENSKNEVAEIKNQIDTLNSQSPALLKMHSDYMLARKKLLLQATYVKLLNRCSWSEVLSVVASELPEELSLVSFRVDESGQATFTGEAFRMESIAQLLRKVETSAILENGKFDYLSEQKIVNKKIFRYGILANIKTGEHEQ
jgi:hypothetical protein